MLTLERENVFMYPLFLKLENKPCLVVGGGRVAQRKVLSLLATGACPYVIAPSLTRQLEEWVKTGRVLYKKDEYHSQNLRHFKCVISATDSQATNCQVYKDAQEQRVLVNVVDDAILSGFYVPSMVKRGKLMLAICTSGKAPYFSRKLRSYLDKKIPENWEQKLDQVYELRSLLTKVKKDKIKTAQVKLQFNKLVADIFKEMDTPLA